MYQQSLCAQVARSLGEPIGLVRGRGFQPLRLRKKSAGPTLSAVTCPFCRQQVFVAKQGEAAEAECRGCDTAFLAEPGDIYEVALGAAERPQPRRFLHELF